MVISKNFDNKKKERIFAKSSLKIKTVGGDSQFPFDTHEDS